MAFWRNINSKIKYNILTIVISLFRKFCLLHVYCTRDCDSVKMKSSALGNQLTAVYNSL